MSATLSNRPVLLYASPAPRPQFSSRVQYYDETYFPKYTSTEARLAAQVAAAEKRRADTSVEAESLGRAQREEERILAAERVRRHNQRFFNKGGGADELAEVRYWAECGAWGCRAVNGGVCEIFRRGQRAVLCRYFNGDGAVSFPCGNCTASDGNTKTSPGRRYGQGCESAEIEVAVP